MTAYSSKIAKFSMQQPRKNTYDDDISRKIMKDELLADPKKAPLKAANKYRELQKK